MHNHPEGNDEGKTSMNNIRQRSAMSILNLCIQDSSRRGNPMWLPGGWAAT